MTEEIIKPKQDGKILEQESFNYEGIDFYCSSIKTFGGDLLIQMIATKKNELEGTASVLKEVDVRIEANQAEKLTYKIIQKNLMDEVLLEQDIKNKLNIKENEDVKLN